MNDKLPNIGKLKLEGLLNNKLINNLMQILGLTSKSEKFSLRYDKIITYDRIIIVTDTYFDGTHIKGLLLYLIYIMWIPLLKNWSEFLSTMNNIIIKVIIIIFIMDVVSDKKVLEV
jgi:DNA gyrase/topoisomerase IV subunit B